MLSFLTSLSFAIYLVDQYYFNISRNSTKVDNINNKRIKIIRKIHDSIKLDLEYIDNWSFKIDIYIIIMTLPIIVKGTGK